MTTMSMVFCVKDKVWLDKLKLLAKLKFRVKKIDDATSSRTSSR